MRLFPNAEPSAPIPMEGTRVLNYRLSQKLHVVHLWIIVSKWSVLTGAPQLDEATVDSVFKAACVLHNYVWNYDSPDMKVEIQLFFRDYGINSCSNRPSNNGYIVQLKKGICPLSATKGVISCRRVLKHASGCSLFLLGKVAGVPGLGFCLNLFWTHLC